jgi:glycerol uptake facilitator-like aquaporin
MVFLWSFELSNDHVGRRRDIISVGSVPGRNVNSMASSAAEAVGTFVMGVGGRLISENPTLSNNDPLLGAAFNAALVVAVIASALDVSGGLFNPMLASVLIGTCDGHSVWQHLAVYWGGGMTGSIAVHFLYPTVHGIAYSSASKVDVNRKID